MILRTGNSAGKLRLRPAFTLIELVLVMALLIVVIAIAAPSLSGFFRGGSLPLEGRRLLALTRHGQSRAISEGIPMILWMNAEQRTYGLQAEPTYDYLDPQAANFTLDKELQMEVVSIGIMTNTYGLGSGSSLGNASMGGYGMMNPALMGSRASPELSLPQIRFLPDGSFSESSVQVLRVFDQQGFNLWLVQATNGLSYELRNQIEPTLAQMR